jgi:hypothetical protein
MGGTGGDALSANDIPIEVWRCLEYMAILWLTKVSNHTFWSNKMHKEWKRSTLEYLFFRIKKKSKL